MKTAFVSISVPLEQGKYRQLFGSQTIVENKMIVSITADNLASVDASAATVASAAVKAGLSVSLKSKKNTEFFSNVPWNHIANVRTFGTDGITNGQGYTLPEPQIIAFNECWINTPNASSVTTGTVVILIVEYLP